MTDPISCYSPAVTRTLNRPPLVSALIALMVALFVLAPLGDALACGPESSEPAATVLVNADVPHDTADECSPAHCAHGHCHAPASLPPQAADASPARTAAIMSDLPPEAIHASATPDGLIRPPRA